MRVPDPTIRLAAALTSKGNNKGGKKMLAIIKPALAITNVLPIQLYGRNSFISNL